MTCFLLSLQKYGLWMLKYLYFVVKCAFTFWISNWTSFYLEFGLNIGHVSVIGIINNVCKNWVFAWIVAHMSCKKRDMLIYFFFYLLWYSAYVCLSALFYQQCWYHGGIFNAYWGFCRGLQWGKPRMWDDPMIRSFFMNIDSRQLKLVQNVF